VKRLAITGWRLTPAQVSLALTVVVGIIAGLAAVLFALAISGTQHLLFGATPPVWRLIAVPALVSVLTGILLVRVFPGVRGSGVPQTKAAYHLNSGVINPMVPIGKFVTGILCIGSGHSIGREGPSVQIGAGIASWAGQWLRLPDAHIRTLVPVGASAALAAAFNTPVAAVLFTLEEIIGDLNAPLLGSAVLSSVTAVIVARSILGNEPLFHVPEYELLHSAELLAYVVLGVIAGAASVAFSKGMLRARQTFLDLPPATRMWQPAMGGLAIGLLLVFVPEVAGVGYAYVDQALNGGLLLQTMLLLCVVKMVATIISYSSGNAGGVFAPTLYFGAMLGGAVGLIAREVFPFPVGEPGAYALVGMGALFAGIIRAPMTSVFMIFEITQDYAIIVPLMVANMLSLGISRRYQRVPLYEAFLLQDGVHLPKTAAAAESPAGWRASDVMSPRVPWAGPDLTAAGMLALMPADAAAVLVGGPDTVLGVARRDELEALVASGRGGEPVTPLPLESFPHVHADHSIDVVIERLRHSCGLVPVLARSDVHRVEGVITRDTIVSILVPAEPASPI
jgi:CIC family chloride channel protein